MCGFAVTICKNPFAKINFEQFKEMTDTLYHRGPDDEGYALFYNGQVFDINNFEKDVDLSLKKYHTQNPVEDNSKIGSIAFGFRRLAILDLSSLGHQPMCYMKRYWIVYNGEIYNYKELRSELIESGYTFKSGTDTEVILAAYDHWGNNCFNKFNGMWAFIIYDVHENKLIISRDRFGIKPLYYFENKDYIILASEIKAIHKANVESKVVDNDSLRSFLTIGDDSYSTKTVLANIKRFPQASFYVTSSENPRMDEVKFTRYWCLKINSDKYLLEQKNVERNLDIYRKLLESAVSLRRRSDVKVGAALSGGLDSSSIVYFIMNAAGSKPDIFETFSNVYNDPGLVKLDESEYINHLTDFLKVKNNKTTPDSDNIFNDFSSMIYHADLPTNTSNISGWYTYKLIRNKGVTVTLDGQGADEMLAGYNSYYLAHLKDLKLRLFLKELKSTQSIYSDLSVKKAIAAKIIRSLPRNLRSILINHLNIKKVIDLPLNQVLALDMQNNLSNLLRYGDFLSMAHSVESRLPFLDYRLVEFVFNLNQSYKISFGWTKYIARIAMSGLLPDKVVWRKEKIGWPNADELWFDKIHKDRVNNTLIKSSLLSNSISSKEKNIIVEGKMNSKKLRALSLSMWEERFL